MLCVISWCFGEGKDFGCFILDRKLIFWCLVRLQLADGMTVRIGRVHVILETKGGTAREGTATRSVAFEKFSAWQKIVCSGA